MRDPASADLVPDHLYLRSFSAINKEQVAVDRYHLAGRVPVKRRHRGIIAKDRDSEHGRIYKFTIDFDFNNSSKTAQRLLDASVI